MEFKGSYLIPAAPETVWNALNDPDVLRRCIPGCQNIEKTDQTHFKASATLKIGPVKATFKAKLALNDLDPPRHCTLKGEGQGGVAGFARGEADITLTAEQQGTLLAYSAQANIGGRLAQIGQRLIDGAAKQIADDFFARFVAAIDSAPPVQPATLVAPMRQDDTTPREGLAPEIWVVGLIALIVALLVLSSFAFGS